jgi:hypothetical protein
LPNNNSQDLNCNGSNISLEPTEEESALSFIYPEDWFPGDWNQSQKQTHLFLGESDPIDIPAKKEAILGPVTWYAENNILSALWGYSLLAAVRADNDDSAGGIGGCGYPYDQDECGT